MRERWLDCPPRWGILALVVLVAGNVALFTLLGLRSAPADPHAGSTRAAAATSPAAVVEAPPAAPVPPSAPPVLAVYGDGYAAGNEAGGIGEAGWPAIVAVRTGARLALSAASRAGYASVGVTGQDYLGLLREGPVGDATVTLLFGSRNDANAAVAQVGANAAEAISEARRHAPGTVVVVIGPAWDDADVPAGVLAIRDAVAEAARQAGATFVDPLAEGWFAENAPGLIGADGVSPTDAGHGYLADRIAPIVEQALAGSAVRPAA
jgi:hypothetical protein